jgi:zinc transport system substrate-binding protein
MILMTRVHLAALAAVLAALLPAMASCSSGHAQAASGVRVVTSFYPLQYVAQRVAGRQADVTNLTHPGQEPHDVELTVRQTADIVDADVMVYERGFQAAVDQAVDQNGPEHVLDAAGPAGLSGDDPHFWLDPTRLSRVAAAFEKQVAEVDPRHAPRYARNLRHLQADLSSLDLAYRRGLSSCRIHTIVASHDAFSYLGRRYGLRVVAINGLSPDAEPSPAHIRQLQDLIRSDGITTVFSERLASPKLTDSLAHDVGIRTAVLDPIEGLSPATADQDYLSLMRSDLRALRKSDQCS